ncbi:MAG TPA: hypothetical protein ENF17_07555 [Candidatus Aminicenantes bacterium]|nr:hypothetical protein [Candidatus Aminicenantes bacterium]
MINIRRGEAVVVGQVREDRNDYQLVISSGGRWTALPTSLDSSRNIIASPPFQFPLLLGEAMGVACPSSILLKLIRRYPMNYYIGIDVSQETLSP